MMTLKALPGNRQTLDKSTWPLDGFQFNTNDTDLRDEHGFSNRGLKTVFIRPIRLICVELERR